MATENPRNDLDQDAVRRIDRAANAILIGSTLVIVGVASIDWRVGLIVAGAMFLFLGIRNVRTT